MGMDMDMVEGGREDGRKKMRERLVRLTGGEKQSPDPPLQTCTPAAIQSQARAVNRSGASGMKQFVESSSIQESRHTSRTLQGGLADRVLVWLTESEVVCRRVASTTTTTTTSTQWTADEDYCAVHTVQYRHADGKGALRISIWYGPFPLCPCPGLGLVPAWKH
jgi:hypothetical protein